MVKVFKNILFIKYIKANCSVFSLVCQMVQQGVAAIVGPNDPSVAAHIQSMSEVLKVPLIETR